MILKIKNESLFLILIVLLLVKCSSVFKLYFSLMVSHKFTIKTTGNAQGEYFINLVLIKDRINTSLSIKKKCKYDDWSFETERLKKSHKEYKQINNLIEKYTSRVNTIIHEFELDETPFTLHDIVTQFKKKSGKQQALSYTAFHESLIEEIKNAGKLSTYSIEKDTLKSIQRFFNRSEITFKDLSVDAIYKYQSFLNGNNNSQSTIGIRIRTLRAVFNKAINREIIPGTIYPFNKFKVSKIKESGKKEYLSEEEIVLLKNAALLKKNDIFARDMFLLSFYGRGINFIDLIQLKKTDLYKETITYKRSKTEVIVNFKINDFWKDKIINYASAPDSFYLFNIIHNNQNSEIYINNKKEKYLKIFINKPLKKIITDLGIKKKITYYCARHSFATILKFNNISLDIIKEALGHKDIKSTMSYLNTLPSNTLDKMIDDIIF
ncbi:site-specific integrase [Flavobacterium sp. IB48]|uniref:tyrosine-type recombinase/integrase n=1 Tax=Flavobacterium sp. IB48 TaxID=2779375 RepID=UPI0018E74471|nr:site-specific integrase [Flavobacterium sp. IB48]MBJ2123914.1 site-specific integrase [Flavobacterium sp. IB48]